MPITRRQFEFGIDSVIENEMRRIYSFLEAHKDEAFTQDELEEALGVPSLLSLKDKQDFAALENFRIGLEKLVEVGAALVSKVRETQYYSISPALSLGSILKP